MVSRHRSLRGLALAALALACAATLSPPAVAWTGGRHDSGVAARRALPWGGPATGYSATLEQCVSSSVPAERSVTFTGQMAAVPGTQRMGMRIDLEERAPGQAAFHTLSAIGLGVWRGSEAGVKVYKYVKRITNLSAPAVYRAVVRFRWLGEKGHVLRRAELRTARCAQPAVSTPEAAAGAQASTAG